MSSRHGIRIRKTGHRTMTATCGTLTCKTNLIYYFKFSVYLLMGAGIRQGRTIYDFVHGELIL